MSNTVIELIVGVVLAFTFLLWTRAQPDAGRRLYAIGLAVTALIYVAFPVIGGADSRSLGLEAVGLLLYGAAAWIGFRKSTALLALGWALHSVWDVALHLQGAGAAYTPDWYPWGCTSFDLVVGGAVFVAGRAPPRVVPLILVLAFATPTAVPAQRSQIMRLDCHTAEPNTSAARKRAEDWVKDKLKAFHPSPEEALRMPESANSASSRR